jgi:hypothetical protein
LSERGFDTLHGSGRVVNTSAKRLVGFSDDEIAALVATAKETIDDASI